MHAECDIAVPILSVSLSVSPSVCLSVCPFNAGTMSKRVDIVARFDALVGTLLYSFRSPTAVKKKSKGNSLSGGVKCTGVGLFFKYRPRKRYDRSVSVPMDDLE